MASDMQKFNLKPSFLFHFFFFAACRTIDEWAPVDFPVLLEESFPLELRWIETNKQIQRKEKLLHMELQWNINKQVSAIDWNLHLIEISFDCIFQTNI